jgi:methyl-accepting chemotaxis protein
MTIRSLTDPTPESEPVRTMSEPVRTIHAVPAGASNPPASGADVADVAVAAPIMAVAVAAPTIAAPARKATASRPASPKPRAIRTVRAVAPAPTSAVAPAPTGAVAMAEIAKVAEAVRAGQLTVRGDASVCSGDDAQLVQMVNEIVDTMARPMRLASRAIDQIAHGQIPDFIIDDYPGDFNIIKRNINTFLATMYGMHHEMQNLVHAITVGKLNTRGNDWDFEGNWRDLIAGVNRTLDAILEPIGEARAVMGRLSEYDLTARMQSSYKGDHAKIKRALNGTAAALHDAIAQVAASVERVSRSGEQIAKISLGVAAGAAEQARSIEETSVTLAEIGQGAVRTAEGTDLASTVTKRAKETVQEGLEAAASMIAAMREIQTSAEGSLTVVQEINEIAHQTDSLASSAAVQAGSVSEASRGFAVVAKTVRDIADGSSAAARRIEEGVRDTGTASTSDAGAKSRELMAIVNDINRIAMHTNVLAVNAAIEAAHVEATGLGLAQVTEQVRELATRSKDAAQKTGTLLQASARLSADGCMVSDEIDRQLQKLAEAVGEVNSLAGRIATDSAEQQRSLDVVTQSMATINGVTQRNAEGAHASSEAADALVQEGRALQSLVSRFQVKA